MSSGFDYALLDRILEAHDCAPRNTIAILQDVQEHYHYLPQEAFPYMANDSIKFGKRKIKNPFIHGKWMKRTSKLKENGIICIEPSMQMV